MKFSDWQCTGLCGTSKSFNVRGCLSGQCDDEETAKFAHDRSKTGEKIGNKWMNGQIQIKHVSLF